MFPSLTGATGERTICLEQGFSHLAGWWCEVQILSTILSRHAEQRRPCRRPRVDHQFRKRVLNAADVSRIDFR